MARHWKCWHPELNKNDYMPNKSRNASFPNYPRRSFDSTSPSMDPVSLPSKMIRIDSIEVEPPAKMIRIDASQPVTIRSGLFDPVTTNKTLLNDPIKSSTSSLVAKSHIAESFMTIKAEPLEDSCDSIGVEGHTEEVQFKVEDNPHIQEEPVDVGGYPHTQGEPVEVDNYSPVTHNLVVRNGSYVCSFQGCDYKSKYNSNMWRHQRKYSHFAADVTSKF